MKIESYNIPQADVLVDVLVDVLNTTVAVSNGENTYQAIAKAINKVERQGRYYRKAAEIIGFIEPAGRNISKLTPLGKKLLNTGSTLDNPLVIKAVLNAKIFQRIIPFLETYYTGISRKEIQAFLSSVADIGKDSMANRRIATVINWLVELEILVLKNSKYFLNTSAINRHIPILNFNELEEPLLYTGKDLKEYQLVQERLYDIRDTILVYKDNIAVERANNSHKRLVNLTAQRIRNAGYLPKYNQLIDLAVRCGKNDYIFEMKSSTQKNEKSQIRKGLSQLYEYRYLQNRPKANLILVLEHPLSPKEAWREEYLLKDRGVLLIWDGNDTLYGGNATRQKLPFLALETN